MRPPVNPTISRRPIIIWLTLHLLQTWMVFVPQHPPLMSVSYTILTWTRLDFPHLLYVSQTIPLSMTNPPSLCCNHYTIRLSRNKHLFQQLPCPRNYYQGHYLLHLWWPNIPHWRNTQPISTGKDLFSLRTFKYDSIQESLWNKISIWL